MKAPGYEYEEQLVTRCHQTVTELRDTWLQAVHGERLNQRRADKAGSDRGSPDYLLTVAGRMIPLEFKRAKGGRFSLDQMVAAERRRAAGVETYAPTRVTEFDCLIAWTRKHAVGICPSCPTVPRP